MIVYNSSFKSIYLDFCGFAKPDYYLKEKYIPWRGSSWWALQYNMELDDFKDFPKGNYLAVSANFLVSGGWTETPSKKRDYAWLDEYELVDKAGSSIFIYYID